MLCKVLLCQFLLEDAVGASVAHCRGQSGKYHGNVHDVAVVGDQRQVAPVQHQALVDVGDHVGAHRVGKRGGDLRVENW